MSYQALVQQFDRIGVLGEVSGILSWDMQTMMPNGSGEGRAGQLATLESMRHEMLSDPRVSDWLDAAEGEVASLDDWQRANLREMRRSWTLATAVEPKLVDALSRAGSACFLTWKDAKPANDWDAFSAKLKPVVALSREAAAARGDALGLAPYDAAIDMFEPGLTAEKVDQVFAPLRARLPDLLQRVIDAQAAADAPLAPEGPFPIATQEALGKRLMEVVGFSFENGRLDVSLHPFCGGSPDDIRITTRYSEDDFASALMGVLHETGHAMYEAQLPREWRHQPVGSARGMALHESQSLLVEMQVCRSRDFLTFAAPLMRDAFGGASDVWDVDNLERLYTRVSRGLIRVDADEVSYPLHVILRFDIERAIFDGSLAVEDIPTAWDEGMERMLGVRPPDFASGCMQDVHWTDGAFGYFPSYTLGAIAAAQIYGAARTALPDVTAQIRAGDFSGLMAWLGQQVHGRGSTTTTERILTDATGRSFDPEAFLSHLESRYVTA